MRRAAPLLALALGLAAGCGQDPRPGDVPFTTTAVEAYLEREVARTTGLAVAVASCPGPLPADDGGTAPCQVEVDGVVLDYEVQRLAGERFEARPARPVVVVSEVVDAVRQQLGDQASEVRCGSAPLWQPPPGDTLRCMIAGGPKPRAALATVEPDGSVRVREA